MPTTIGAKIDLAGEREFRQALSNINNNLRLTASELTLVTARYSENANSVTALTAKGEVLQKQINEQIKRVDTLRDALEKSTEVYGETDARTIKWQESLNKAEAELINIEKELRKNNAALEEAKKKQEEAGNSTAQLGEKIADLANKFGINLPGGVDKALRSLDNAKATTIALVGAVAGIITAFGKMTIETSKAADEILTLSTVTGLSTDKIQEFKYASELIDVPLETMTNSMSRMIRAMYDAQNGSKNAADAFRKLHVGIRDSNGQLKDAETMFYQVIDALGRVRNETERDALAMQIFGRSARELNPLIEAGSESLREFADEAHKIGYVIDPEKLGKFGALNDAMERFKNQATAIKSSLAMALLPVLTAFFEILNKIDPKIIATVAILGSVAAIALTVVKAIKLVADVFGLVNPAMTKTAGIITMVVAGLIALAAIIAVILGKTNDLGKAMEDIGAGVGNVTNTINTAPTRVRYSYASGIDYVPSDRVALIHRGEAVIPANENPFNPYNRGAWTGGDIINVTINARDIKEFNDIVRMAKGAKQARRAGVVMA